MVRGIRRKKRPNRDRQIKLTLASGPLAHRVNKSGNFRGTHPNNRRASRKNIRVAQLGRVKKTIRMRDALEREVEMCRIGEINANCEQLEEDLDDLNKSLDKWSKTFKKAWKNGELTPDILRELKSEGLI